MGCFMVWPCAYLRASSGSVRRLPMSQASMDQLVWMCSSPKYALRSGLGFGGCSGFDVWAFSPVAGADSGLFSLLQEIRVPMLRRTNAKAAVAATLVFITASVLLNGTTTIPRR